MGHRTRRTTALTSAATRRLALAHRLAHELESTLLRNKAERAEVLDGLLARSMLLARNDAAVVLHQIFLGEATRGVFCGSVENLGFGANGGNV